MEAESMDVEGPPTSTRFDELCTGPPNAAKDENPLVRSATSYKNKDERFILTSKAYNRQYAPIYFQRLTAMRPRLLKRVSEEWKGVPVSTILTLPEDQEVAVIGTVYKEMKLKPSILDEYVKDRAAAQLIGRAKFTAEDDTLILEDESARMTLRGLGDQVGDIVTGVVMAVRGIAAPGGDFHVTAVLFVGLQPQPPLEASDGEPDSYVALLSGLGVGDENADPMPLSLVVDYLTGLLGSGEEQQRVSQVVRTIIVGGLMRPNDALAQSTAYAKARDQTNALAPVRELDMCLCQLASAMPVDVMPGPHDPANHSLPQQPLHHCLFPGAGAFSTFNRVTNPHECEISGVSFLGTSGQNVDDAYKYSSGEDRLDLLESCMEWGHAIPTAPDTLTTYPFADQDPFILEECPHVFFAGNQPSFATRMLTGPQGQRVRLICVPKFSSSATLVLVNLTTLAVHPIRFDTRIEA